MRVINLLISLFSIIETKALECVSVINRKCMPRPKTLDVNEGVGEALFDPYNVLVNKCSGSCNALDDPMAKLCVPNIIVGLFSVVMFAVIVFFCVFTYFKWFKGKKLLKNKYTDY